MIKDIVVHTVRVTVSGLVQGRACIHPKSPTSTSPIRETLTNNPPPSDVLSTRIISTNVWPRPPGRLFPLNEKSKSALNVSTGTPILALPVVRAGSVYTFEALRFSSGSNCFPGSRLLPASSIRQRAPANESAQLRISSASSPTMRSAASG